MFVFLAFGFCEYENPEGTLRCIRLLNGWQIQDKKLVVSDWEFPIVFFSFGLSNIRHIFQIHKHVSVLHCVRTPGSFQSMVRCIPNLIDWLQTRDRHWSGNNF